jgi:hypothetical protein
MITAAGSGWPAQFSDVPSAWYPDLPAAYYSGALQWFFPVPPGTVRHLVSFLFISAFSTYLSIFILVQ